MEGVSKKRPAMHDTETGAYPPRLPSRSMQRLGPRLLQDFQNIYVSGGRQLRKKASGAFSSFRRDYCRS
jgi:hypothetical protein